ncbi:hypothetical protein PSTH1771_26715 [Pseudomonas syringae pv. theae]|uniref:hypothetical protein n=1 Tax=Pseudomonas syringae TaxID=317 RepID=UPI0023C04C61|nr:hypothetical protein [Pseudomonas syringae]GKS08681.1 hypothetical protein PSTH1771_26715 [Pseudomonas syringae pv. theae]
MSIIAIVIDERKIKPTALIQLHKALNQPLQTLKSLCNEGDPILEIEVFEGDLQERLKTIRSVLEIVSGEKIAAAFYEIPYGEKYAGNKNLDKREVTADFVNRMLNALDDEFERQSNN